MLGPEGVVKVLTGLPVANQVLSSLRVRTFFEIILDGISRVALLFLRSRVCLVHRVTI